MIYVSGTVEYEVLRRVVPSSEQFLEHVLRSCAWKSMSSRRVVWSVKKVVQNVMEEKKEQSRCQSTVQKQALMSCKTKG
eukprot:3016708-Rhodomonas_salina.1